MTGNLRQVVALLILLAGCNAVHAQPDAGAIVDEINGLFEKHSAVMLLIDPGTGRILSANRAAAEFYGYTAQALEEMSIQEINLLTDAQVAKEIGLAQQQTRNYFVFRHRVASGEVRTVEVHSSPLRWRGQTALLSIIDDISERESVKEALGNLQAQQESTIARQTDKIQKSARQTELSFGLLAVLALIAALYLWRSRQRLVLAEKDSEEQRRRFADILLATGVGTWEWLPEEDQVEVNERFAMLLGTTQAELGSMTFTQFQALIHLEDRDSFQSSIEDHIAARGEQCVCEVRMRRHDSGWVWVRLRGRIVRRYPNGKPALLAGAMRDINERKASDDKLYRLANYDPLTGLANRSMLIDRLQQAMRQADRRGGSMSLAFLDLDDFKPVNDRFGHEFGDEALIHIGARMLNVLREGDTLARIGGDEFVAVLPDAGSGGDNLALFRRLLAAAAEPLHIGEQRIVLGASIGVSSYPQSRVLDADQLLRQADQAMYEAKEAGKNRIKLFDLTASLEQQARRHASSDLMQAIDAGQLVLHYQPRIHLRTARLVGAEALLRWQHPVQGLLQPASFLTTIDGSDEAARLGEWVIREALRQCESWYLRGFHCPVSVNIDVMHMQRDDFVGSIAAILADFVSLPSGYLELEILETSALEEETLAGGVIHRCRELGVRVALDDFGTGFSPLSYLKSVPADCLKIDRSFVIDMIDDPNDLSIIKGVLGLASAFNREVVAEGVESEEHGKLLVSLGCQFAQGYAIAKAMPAGELRDWSETWVAPLSWRKTLVLPIEEHIALYALIELRGWQKAIRAYLEANGLRPVINLDATGLANWLGGVSAQALRSQPQVYTLHKAYDMLQSISGELRSTSPSRSERELFAEFLASCDSAEASMRRLIDSGVLSPQRGQSHFVGEV